jgi:phosphohistidine phosphatase
VTAGRVTGGRRLVLLRHAKSDWPDVADHDRPLAKRGRRDAPVAGRWLGESGYAPDAVICSTAQRARETWELAAGGLQAAVPGAAPVVRYEPRVYEASVLGLLMLVREFSAEWSTALVVGHNPGVAELTHGLTDPPPDPPAAFPTAAIAVLALSGSWSQAGPGEAKLLAFAVPADMHSLFTGRIGIDSIRSSGLRRYVDMLSVLFDPPGD